MNSSRTRPAVAAASITRRACSVTSGPTPSPPMTATRMDLTWPAPSHTWDRRTIRAPGDRRTPCSEARPDRIRSRDRNARPRGPADLHRTTSTGPVPAVRARRLRVAARRVRRARQRTGAPPAPTAPWTVAPPVRAAPPVASTPRLRPRWGPVPRPLDSSGSSMSRSVRDVTPGEASGGSSGSSPVRRRRSSRSASAEANPRPGSVPSSSRRAAASTAGSTWRSARSISRPRTATSYSPLPAIPRAALTNPYGRWVSSSRASVTARPGSPSSARRS